MWNHLLWMCCYISNFSNSRSCRIVNVLLVLNIYMKSCSWLCSLFLLTELLCFFCGKSEKQSVFLFCLKLVKVKSGFVCGVNQSECYCSFCSSDEIYTKLKPDIFLRVGESLKWLPVLNAACVKGRGFSKGRRPRWWNPFVSECRFLTPLVSRLFCTFCNFPWRQICCSSAVKMNWVNGNSLQHRDSCGLFCGRRVMTNCSERPDMFISAFIQRPRPNLSVYFHPPPPFTPFICLSRLVLVNYCPLQVFSVPWHEKLGDGSHHGLWM